MDPTVGNWDINNPCGEGYRPAFLHTGMKERILIVVPIQPIIVVSIFFSIPS